MTFDVRGCGSNIELNNVAEMSIRRTKDDNLYYLRYSGVAGDTVIEELVTLGKLRWLAESGLPAVRKCITAWSCDAARKDLNEELVVCFRNAHVHESFHRIRRKTPNEFGSYEYNAVRNDVIQITGCCCVDTPRVSNVAGWRKTLRVALYPRAAGFLAHEIIGHPIETESSLRRMISEAILFPNILSVADNPGMDARYGSYEHDGIGNDAQCVRCVTEGRLVDSLQGGGRLPRNIRREHANCELETRMSNLVVNSNELIDEVDADLYLYDCIEGEEPTVDNPVATIVGILPEVDLYGRRKSSMRVKCSFVIHEFAQNVIGAFGSQCWRPIDCFQEKSGWVRTSVESPGLVVEVRRSAINFDQNGLGRLSRE